jgi:hypothetical protein
MSRNFNKLNWHKCGDELIPNFLFIFRARSETGLTVIFAEDATVSILFSSNIHIQ